MNKVICLWAVLATTSLHAGEAIVTLHSTVSGSQDQPRVMYILPWQQPGDIELDYELRNSLADELFVPIDRDEFVRGLAYGDMLDASAAAKAEPAGEQTLDHN